jgi:hypothetical protein
MKQQYKDWLELADTLDEDEIVRMVNLYLSIRDDYERLRGQEDARKDYHRRRQALQKAILTEAKRLLAPDEIATLREQSEGILTKNGERRGTLKVT